MAITVATNGVDAHLLLPEPKIINTVCTTLLVTAGTVVLIEDEVEIAKDLGIPILVDSVLRTAHIHAINVRLYEVDSIIIKVYDLGPDGTDTTTIYYAYVSHEGIGGWTIHKNIIVETYDDEFPQFDVMELHDQLGYFFSE